MNSHQTRIKWDRIHSASSTPAKACDVLQRFGYLLPDSGGSALDLACGAGGNALLLAAHGLQTTALDISSSALQRVATAARSKNLTIKSVHADAAQVQLGCGQYDVIVVSKFLDRAVCQQLVPALKPGGLLYYQTFVQDKVDADQGPSNPDFLLATGELLRMFAELRILYYHDVGSLGDPEQGFRNQAMLVARKEISDE